jgi:hypothetical protein
LLPYIKGNNLRMTYYGTIFNRKRWYARWGVGISGIKLNLKMVDGSPQVHSLDSLIANPALTSSIDIIQSLPTVGLDGRSGIYFRTKWLKKIVDDFDIGFTMGYFQPISRRGVEWVVNGTVNNFLRSGVPNIYLDNLNMQVSFSAVFKTKSEKTETNKSSEKEK